MRLAFSTLPVVDAVVEGCLQVIEALDPRVFKSPDRSYHQELPRRKSLGSWGDDRAVRVFHGSTTTTASILPFEK